MRSRIDELAVTPLSRFASASASAMRGASAASPPEDFAVWVSSSGEWRVIWFAILRSSKI
jgi:hypothetical protein